MAETPHFALPFKFALGSAVVVEQDSRADILACAEAIVRYTVGQRPESPDFGIPDQLFGQVPVDVDAVRQAVDTWEPRVRTEVTQDYDAAVAAVIEKVFV